MRGALKPIMYAGRSLFALTLLAMGMVGSCGQPPNVAQNSVPQGPRTRCEAAYDAMVAEQTHVADRIGDVELQSDLTLDDLRRILGRREQRSITNDQYQIVVLGWVGVLSERADSRRVAVDQCIRYGYDTFNAPVFLVDAEFRIPMPFWDGQTLPGETKAYRLIVHRPFRGTADGFRLGQAATEFEAALVAAGWAFDSSEHEFTRDGNSLRVYADEAGSVSSLETGAPTPAPAYSMVYVPRP